MTKYSIMRKHSWKLLPESVGCKVWNCYWTVVCRLVMRN